MPSEKINKLHWHRCYSCEDMLVCACNDRRQFDREAGKERRVYCFACANLDIQLTAAFLPIAANLERIQ